MSQSIIHEACDAYGVDPEDFFSSEVKLTEIVACRIYAIARLRAEGFSKAATARVMRRHYDTIRYWTAKPGILETKRSYARARWHRMKGQACHDQHL